MNDSNATEKQLQAERKIQKERLQTATDHMQMRFDLEAARIDASKLKVCVLYFITDCIISSSATGPFCIID